MLFRVTALVALAFAIAVAQRPAPRVFRSDIFSIEVPAGFTFYTNTPAAHTTACERSSETYPRPVAQYGWDHDHLLSKRSLVCIEFPQGAFIGTTFSDAALQAVEITNLHTAGECESFAPPAGMTVQPTDGAPRNDVHTESIGGIRFLVGSFGAVAAGHVSSMTLYRTFRNGRCYEFSADVEFGDYAGDSGQTKLFTPAQEREVREELKKILATIRFRYQ